jgi:serine/threonine-protein kinase
VSSVEELPRLEYGEALGRGQLVGRYIVDECHARAGFSTVYRATDTSTGQRVALKVLHQELSRSAKSIERFRREYDALVALEHPNIVEMLDWGEVADGRPYFAMEWCEGAPLGTFLHAGPFTLEEALPIVAQVIDALQAVHDVGVIHRDIKAWNIMLQPSDRGAPRVKLIDFGISKPSDYEEAQRTSLTTTGSALGTPHSMAPEQIHGLSLDTRTDIYALGVLLYEMLTGQKPYRGSSVAEVVDHHLNTPPPDVSEVAPVPKKVGEILQRCLAKHREDRFAQVRDVLVALRKAASGLDSSTHAQPDPKPVTGIALHVSFYFRCSEDEVEEEDFDLMDDLLSEAIDGCEGAGLRVAMMSGDGFLAIGMLPPGAGPRNDALRRDVIDLARDLGAHFTDGASDSDLRVRCVLHSAPVVAGYRNGKTEFLGGELLALTEWSVSEGDELVVATKAAIAGLESELNAGLLGRTGFHRIPVDPSLIA